jgi:hypothetical protein
LTDQTFKQTPLETNGAKAAVNDCSVVAVRKCSLQAQYCSMDVGILQFLPWRKSFHEVMNFFQKLMKFHEFFSMKKKSVKCS